MTLAEFNNLAEHDLAALMPEMDEEQFAALKDSIELRGARNPIILYEGQILDGRHRYRALKELAAEGKSPAWRVEDLPADDDPVEYVLDQNANRRDMTPGGRAQTGYYLSQWSERGNLLGNNQFERKSHKSEISYCAHVPRGYCQDCAARRMGTQPQKISQYKEIQSHPEFDDEMRRAIGKGLLNLNRADEELNNRVREKKAARDARIRQLIKSHGFPQVIAEGVADGKVEEKDAISVKDTDEDLLTAAYERLQEDSKVKTLKQSVKTLTQERAAEAARNQKQDETIPVYQCSCLDLIGYVEEGSVEAIITDPPYGPEYLHCWDELAAFADHALKPGGMLVAISGRYDLPTILNKLSAQLEYRWVGNMALTAQMQEFAAKVYTHWKPILIFAKPGGEWHYINDTYTPDKEDYNTAKDTHRWGQPLSVMRKLVDGFTLSGGLVADPFCGGGTTLVAAKAAGREIIGGDIDPDSVALTKKRLKEEEQE